MEDHSDICRFIIATNEDTLDSAIKSRCLQFTFSKIPSDLIAKYLVWILKQESAEIDVTQVKTIAKLANGDLRQALVMLDGYVSGRKYKEVAEGSLLSHKFEDIRKLSYELDVRYLFNLLDQELGRLHEKGTDIRRAVLALSDYEFRASQATIGAIHFQSCWMRVKQALAEKK